MFCIFHRYIFCHFYFVPDNLSQRPSASIINEVRSGVLCNGMFL
jgi:hypothetical protein